MGVPDLLWATEKVRREKIHFKGKNPGSNTDKKREKTLRDEGKILNARRENFQPERSHCQERRERGRGHEPEI